MSKELEVLERFYKNTVVYGKDLYERNIIDDKSYRKGIDCIDKDYDLLKEALKRNEPMKPQTERYTNGFFKRWACSVCGTTIQKAFVCCPYCRQELDWSAELDVSSLSSSDCFVNCEDVKIEGTMNKESEALLHDKDDK